jgi:hypothetical protein
VTAVFDAPVASINIKNTLWVGLLRRSTGNAVSDVTRGSASFFLCKMSFYDESLSDLRKVKVVIEFGCGPNLSDFDASMLRGIILNEIGLLPVLEVQRNVFKNCGLVCFDGEMIMSMTLVDQVLSYLALGQQRIGSHILAFNIDGVKKRDGHFDFVGAFDLFAVFYRQSSDFFWV